MDQIKETLELWQPITSLKGEYEFKFNFVEVLRHNNYLKISLADHFGNLVDIIYEDPMNVCPFEYSVWSFRHSTELGNLHKSRFEIDNSKLIDKKAIHFCKVRNSDYINSFDNNPIGNKKLFPDVEHHMYLTGDEIFEVISNYEPRFVEKNIKNI